MAPRWHNVPVPLVLSLGAPSRRGEGVHDLWMDGGLPPGFEKGTLVQSPKIAVISTCMMNFEGKLPIFCYFSPISG